MAIKREHYLEQLVSARNNGFIKVVTGIRRCGKSYLLFHLFVDYLLAHGFDEEHIIRLELDRRSNKSLRDVDQLTNYLLGLVQDDGNYVILLDEIQLVPHFEEVLNELLHLPNVDTYVTGSNSKFLSSDIITEFRGRSWEIRVRPLSFSEYHGATGNPIEKDWADYLIYGGMPMALSLPSLEARAQYLKQLFSETYLIDIIERYHLNGQEEIEELTNIVASAIGSLVNPSKLEKSYQSVKQKKLSAVTIRKYLSYLEDAFIIAGVKRYDVKGKRYINTPQKFYFTDPGLRNACLHFRQIEESHLMENILYNELVSQGYTVDVGVVEYNAKNESGCSVRKQLEVDFVCNQGSKRIYVQSSLTLSGEKYLQEVASLMRLHDSFRKVIIVKGYYTPTYTDDGVLVIGLYHFLENPTCITLA